jgi:rhodanese-related sulfurtransferase
MRQFASGLASWIAVALLAALVTLTPRASGDEPFKMISADEVERRMSEPGVYVFDVNSAERFRQSRLPGAIHVSKDNVAERLPPNKDATLVFYCANPR